MNDKNQTKLIIFSMKEQIAIDVKPIFSKFQFHLSMTFLYYISSYKMHTSSLYKVNFYNFNHLELSHQETESSTKVTIRCSVYQNLHLGMGIKKYQIQKDSDPEHSDFKMLIQTGWLDSVQIFNNISSIFASTTLQVNAHKQTYFQSTHMHFSLVPSGNLALLCMHRCCFSPPPAFFSCTTWKLSTIMHALTFFQSTHMYVFFSCTTWKHHLLYHNFKKYFFLILSFGFQIFVGDVMSGISFDQLCATRGPWAKFRSSL